MHLFVKYKDSGVVSINTTFIYNGGQEFKVITVSTVGDLINACVANGLLLGLKIRRVYIQFSIGVDGPRYLISFTCLQIS